MSVLYGWDVLRFGLRLGVWEICGSCGLYACTFGDVCAESLRAESVLRQQGQASSRTASLEELHREKGTE